MKSFDPNIVLNLFENDPSAREALKSGKLDDNEALKEQFDSFMQAMKIISSTVKTFPLDDVDTSSYRQMAAVNIGQRLSLLGDDDSSVMYEAMSLYVPFIDLLGKYLAVAVKAVMVDNTVVFETFVPATRKAYRGKTSSEALLLTSLMEDAAGTVIPIRNYVPLIIGLITGEEWDVSTVEKVMKKVPFSSGDHAAYSWYAAQRKSK